MGEEAPLDRGTARRGDVELRLPADTAFVSVLRTTTASLAARLDFTIDDIEDLRIAVGEACAMVLEQADDDVDLTCAFHLGQAELTVDVSVPAATPETPSLDGFAWQVLSALTTSAAVYADSGVLTVSMTKHSGAGT